MTAMERATTAWGRTAPDWIIALAEECDRTSQRRAAERISYSPAAVNQILSKTYKAGLKRR